MADDAHKIITMGCVIDESCPATFMLTEDWGLDDPAGQPMEEVRRIRDQIERKVSELIEQEGS
jgi:protein-tyrosine-phosphatase